MEEVKENIETPDWLKKIQARSWEAELLVSGGALFSLIQLLSTSFEMFIVSERINAFVGSFYFMLPLFGLIAISAGFIIHLVFRGFWLSLVVLHRVYPGGIQIEKIKLSEPYLSQTKKFDLRKYLHKIDRNCSLIFSWSFTLALIMFGYAISSSLLMTPTFILIDKPELENLILFKILSITASILTLGWFLFIYIDLFSSGYFRRGTIRAKVYYPFYKLYNSISLGFLWRPILQTLITNQKNKTKFVLLLLGGYLLIMYSTIFAFSFLRNKSKFFELFKSLNDKVALVTTREIHYRDAHQESEESFVTIQSNIIKENYLEIFVPFQQYWEADSTTKGKKYFGEIISIGIDDSLYQKITWVGLIKSNGGKGVTAIVPIKHLKDQWHNLLILTPKQDTLKIPFWKQ